MRVLLADSHQEVRWALRTFLAEQLEWASVVEAADVEDLMSKTETSEPDVILLDWNLPGWCGEAQLADLHRLGKQVRIVVLCRRPEMEPVVLAAGADAFVSTSSSPAQLLAKLRVLNWSHLARGGHEPSSNSPS